MSTKRAIILISAAIVGGLALKTGLLMNHSYIKLRNKYPRVDKDYPIGPGTVIVVTRPGNHRPFDMMYPFINYTFFLTKQGTFGFQFCDIFNFNHCPKEFGPTIRPNVTTYDNVKDKHNWDYFLVAEGDPDKAKCVIETAKQIYDKYEFNSELEAITKNIYHVFIEDVLTLCGL